MILKNVALNTAHTVVLLLVAKQALHSCVKILNLFVQPVECICSSIFLFSVVKYKVEQLVFDHLFMTSPWFWLLPGNGTTSSGHRSVNAPALLILEKICLMFPSDFGWHARETRYQIYE